MLRDLAPGVFACPNGALTSGPMCVFVPAHAAVSAESAYLMCCISN